MKGSLPVNGTFFSASVLIIAGWRCTRDVCGTNTELLVGNTKLKTTKRHFPVVLKRHFIVFNKHAR